MWMRPLSLVAALALIVGVMLTALNLLPWGWTIYAVGHVLAIAALAAYWVANRGRFDPWATLGLLVLLVGLVLALPQVATIWQDYSTPTAGQPMELPVWTAPLGLTAELVTWIGAAFFGLAGRGAHVLPRGIAWVLVAAAVIGLIAALYIVSPYAWVPAMLLLAISLLAFGATSRRSGV
jgi:hypothetical protein